jgi:hypothetical protein
VRRSPAVIAVALALVAFAGCGGGDEEPNTSPAPAETPGGRATSPSAGGLPPELVECFADQGFDLESPADLHSAPPQVVQECFGSLHQGGREP